MDLPNNAGIVLLPAHNLQVITIQNYLCCMGVLCTCMTLTDLQILDCELHKNKFGGRIRWGAVALPQIP